MHDAYDNARAQGAKAGHAIKDGLTDGKAHVEALYAQNPVLGLAIGIGIGALLGAVTPMSRQEEELLAKPVGKAATAAAHLGGQALDKLDAMASASLKSSGAPVGAGTPASPAGH